MTVRQTTVNSRSALEAALSELFGAERRLRCREQQADHELTTAQLRALAALDKSDAVTAGQLAKAARLNPGSVTAMVDNLEERGIVQRSADERDRRVSMISLTDAGRAVVARRKALWDSLWHEHLGGLSDEELLDAVRAMHGIAAMLDAL